jgi:hypothetical protein
MRERSMPLWMARSANQVVAQFTGRRAPTRYAPTELHRVRLIKHLCLELLAAIAARIPDDRIADELFAIIRKENADAR